MTFEEAQARIKEIGTAAVTRVEDARKKCEKNSEAVEKGYEALSDALKREDHDAYNKAKTAISKAEADRDYYAAVIQQAEKSPVITLNEYAKIGTAILDAIRIVKADEQQKVIETVATLEAIITEARQERAPMYAAIKELEKLPKLLNKEASGYYQIGATDSSRDYKPIIQKLKEVI